MRRSLGTAVLFGMLGVTCFGLLFTPAFYTFIRKIGQKERTLTEKFTNAPRLTRGPRGRTVSPKGSGYGE
jgi:hypothetical protein